jgi:hypothetical protein
MTLQQVPVGVLAVPTSDRSPHGRAATYEESKASRRRRAGTDAKTDDRLYSGHSRVSLSVADRFDVGPSTEPAGGVRVTVLGSIMH